jgi:hypothetical protein
MRIVGSYLYFNGIETSGDDVADPPPKDDAPIYVPQKPGAAC